MSPEQCEEPDSESYSWDEVKEAEKLKVPHLNSSNDLNLHSISGGNFRSSDKGPLPFTARGGLQRGLGRGGLNSSPV